MSALIYQNRSRCVGAVLALLAATPTPIFGQSVSLAPPASTTQASSAETGSPPVGARPQYPGIGPSGDKLEAEMGAFKIRLYGTVLLNTAVSDAAILGQDVPLWTLGTAGTVTYPDGTVGTSGGNHDLIFTMRQSVVGFTVNPARPTANSWTPSGLIEVDFFGTRPVDTIQPLNRVLNQPRLRLAYFQLERNGVKVVFGQDKAILAPLDPISLSHVALPLGATAGDLWAWLPQIRVDVTRTMGTTGVLFQGGILSPQFGDPRLETPPTASTSLDGGSSGLGARSTKPFFQGRVAVSPQIRGSASTFGIAGHFGEEKIGVDRELRSWAVAFDGSATVDPHVVLRGEAFTGSNLIPFQGGIQQGAAVLAAPVTAAPPLQIQAIDSRGGWGELTILPTSSGKNAFYVGAGTDRPNVDTLLPGSGRIANTFIWASYFRRLTDSVTLAAEWSNWRFTTITFVNNAPGPASPTSIANVLNVSFAYQF
jgi:hypothetical protein